MQGLFTSCISKSYGSLKKPIAQSLQNEIQGLTKKINYSKTVTKISLKTNSDIVIY